LYVYYKSVCDQPEEVLEINYFVQLDWSWVSWQGLGAWVWLGLAVFRNIQTGCDTHQSPCQIGTEGPVGKVPGTWSW